MKRATAPNYDLFKLVVTIILGIILILMLLRGCATMPVPITSAEASGSAPTPSDVVSVATEGRVTATDTVEPTTEPPLPSATPTAVAPTVTPTAEPATPTEGAATATPEATVVTPDATATATAPAASGAETTSCNSSVTSRLSVGQTARVLQRLNMRGEASITAPILQTNTTNTEVEIIGGPVCTPVGERAYLWWQIRLADGTEGWSAESPLNEPIYLLEPIP
jgi:hypothetical protein